MNKELTQEDYKNLLLLIERATLNGKEAMSVAILINKINQLIVPTEAPVTGTTDVPKEDEPKS